MRRPRPFPRRPAGPSARINSKIRAREVRLVDKDGSQLGVHSLAKALTLARALNVDLVEIAAQAEPPVCRLISYGEWKYREGKKEKNKPKNRLKEIKLSASIDDHDVGIKLARAVDFLCDDLTVKITLRFRGRENAHKEYGFQIVRDFVHRLEPYGKLDAPPRLSGRFLHALVSPLPRGKRAERPQTDHPPARDPADSPPETEDQV